MTNKLVIIINSLKVPKIEKILLYEMKFFVPKQLPPEHVTRGLPPPDPRYLCPLSSTEFVEPPPGTKFLGTPLASNAICIPIRLVNKQILYSICVLTEHFLSSSGETNLSDQ